jgi:hypothetical protein
MAGPSLQLSRWTKLEKRVYSSLTFAQNINYAHIDIELLTTRWQQTRGISKMSTATYILTDEQISYS